MDTYQTYKKLRGVGFTEAQAEGMLDAVRLIFKSRGAEISRDEARSGIKDCHQQLVEAGFTEEQATVFLEPIGEMVEEAFEGFG